MSHVFRRQTFLAEDQVVVSTIADVDRIGLRDTAETMVFPATAPDAIQFEQVLYREGHGMFPSVEWLQARHDAIVQTRPWVR